MDPNSPELKSFVEVPSTNPFPIQNLPFGVFKNKDGEIHCATAIGDFVLDLSLLEEEGYLGQSDKVFDSSTLNKFISKGRGYWRKIRQIVSDLLRHDQAKLRDNKNLLQRCLIPQRNVTMQMPIEIGDYTDFYSSREHASNVGSMVRDPKNPLQPNWHYLPVGYHGRASSIVISGTPIYRPWGQRLEGETPHFSPTRRLDFELELAFVIGKNSTLAKPIPISEAEEHIFGFVLLNDWSARDIQRWEYVPLGPFVSKSFATSISPWIVTTDALMPFRVRGPVQEPKPFPYLQESTDTTHYDISLEVAVAGAASSTETVVSRTNASTIYWSTKQQVAHHTITGCNLKVGDLMASGTISGKEKGSFGSLLELSWNATEPVNLDKGQTRTFLEDGDTVTMRGYCQGPGYQVGFGEVTGKVMSAIDF